MFDQRTRVAAAGLGGGVAQLLRGRTPEAGPAGGDGSQEADRDEHREHHSGYRFDADLPGRQPIAVLVHVQEDLADGERGDCESPGGAQTTDQEPVTAVGGGGCSFDIPTALISGDLQALDPDQLEMDVRMVGRVTKAYIWRRTTPISKRFYQSGYAVSWSVA